MDLVAWAAEPRSAKDETVSGVETECMEHFRTEKALREKPGKSGTTHPAHGLLGKAVGAAPSPWWRCGREGWLHAAFVPARGWDNARFRRQIPHGATPAL